MKNLLFIVLATVFAVASCDSTTHVVVEPKDVTVELEQADADSEAIMSIADGGVADVVVADVLVEAKADH